MAKATFYLEKRKNKKTETLIVKSVPINLSFTFLGHRILLFSGERIDADKWDAKRQQVKAGVAGRAEINYLLQSQAELIMKVYREARINNISPTPEFMKRKFHETRSDNLYKEKGLFDLFNDFVNIKRKTVSQGYCRHLVSVRNHLAKFIKKTGINSGFDNIDLAWLESFQGFLIQEHGSTHNTVSAIIKHFKTFLNYATKTGHNRSTLYKEYKISWKRGEIIYLTWDELLHLYQCPMPSESLAQVRDVFCFACFSGMRYSDLKNLTKDCVHDGYIRYNMVKTRQHVNHTIPLNDFSKEILERYKQYPWKEALPVISNQKMNEYLKEVGKIAEIDQPTTIVKIKGSERVVKTSPKYELLSSHVGRKTFITNALQKGILAEVVMGISGHSDHKSFKHYYSITEEHKQTEMSKHFSKPLSLSQDKI